MEGLWGEEKLKIAASDNDESVFLFFLVAIEIAAGAHFFDDINCLKIDIKYFLLAGAVYFSHISYLWVVFFRPWMARDLAYFLPVFLSQQISGVFFRRCSFLEFYLTAVGKRYQETPLKGVPPAVR